MEALAETIWTPSLYFQAKEGFAGYYYGEHLKLRNKGRMIGNNLSDYAIAAVNSVGRIAG